MEQGNTSRETSAAAPSRPKGNPRPLWLLDFDGTINPLVGDGRNDRTAWADWKRTRVVDEEGTGFPISYSPSVVALVVEAVDAGIDVQLLSDWRHEAPLICGAVGLPPLPWIAFTPSRTAVTWPKLQAARAVAMNRPLLWTDDDIFRSLEATQWLKRRRAETLHFSPPSRVGLTQKMTRDIRSWIARHSNTITAGKAQS